MLTHLYQGLWTRQLAPSSTITSVSSAKLVQIPRPIPLPQLGRTLLFDVPINDQYIDRAIISRAPMNTNCPAHSPTSQQKLFHAAQRGGKHVSGYTVPVTSLHASSNSTIPAIVSSSTQPTFTGLA
jgi:hypothetical protein